VGHAGEIPVIPENRMEKLYVFNVNFNRITGVWTRQLMYANGTGSYTGLECPRVTYRLSHHKEKLLNLKQSLVPRE